MAAADIRRGRGRPGHLTPELAAEIVARLDAGATLADAARACGVGERTLRTWRRRAWSPRPADAPFVRLEKRVLGALARARAAELPSMDWQQVAAQLEAEAPTRWAPPALDDVLDELK